LAARLQRSGPIRLTEARELLQGILGALAALHERRLAHGDLRLENVLLVPSFAGEHVVLLDPGSDHLRAPAPVANGQRVADRHSRQQRSGAGTDCRESGRRAQRRLCVRRALAPLLSGKPVFASESPIEALVGHLTREPEPVSEAAPRGWVTSEIDNFVLGLLDKDPSHRPKDAAAVLESLELLGEHVSVPGASLSEEELEQRMTALVTNPWDEEEAAMLESAIDEGVDPGRVAYGFRWVAEQLNPSEGGASERAQKRMLSARPSSTKPALRIRVGRAHLHAAARDRPLRRPAHRRRLSECAGGSANSTSWWRCCSRAARHPCPAAKGRARSPKSARSTTTT
jgi:hypothetical protein